VPTCKNTLIFCDNDINTRSFHAVAITRKNINCNISLKNPNEVRDIGASYLCNNIHGYFVNLNVHFFLCGFFFNSLEDSILYEAR
jgi:hypothetical protein